MGRKSQDPDALTMTYKRNGHDSLIPQNLYSVRNGVTRGRLGWCSLMCWASLREYDFEVNATGVKEFLRHSLCTRLFPLLCFYNDLRP